MIELTATTGVVGVGVDAVDVERFRRVLARRPGVAARFFTDIEQADCHRANDPTESLAARFAAKEAVMKALGTGLGGFALTEVEVRRTPGAGARSGAPYLVLHGAAATLADQRHAGQLHLSLTHTTQTAIAFVVAERGLGVKPVLSVAEMRAADAAALAEVSHDTLVARAGTAVAVAALRMLGGAYGRRVAVVAGRGSNGADARVAAAHLSRRGARVALLDPAALPPHLPVCDLLIDGAYGTGFHGSYDAPAVPPGTPVLAIDLPSGLDADTGRAGPGATVATHTVTFAAHKTGLLQGDGPRLSGHVTVADIGIGTGSPAVALVEDADLALLPPRPRQSHKWTTALGVAAGSVGMEGSAVLCTRGAMAAGAGMIRLGTPGDPVGPWPVEAVRASLPAQRWAGAFLAATAKCHAVVIGPGLGTGDATTEEVQAVIASCPLPLVIDADGLTALGDLATAQFLLGVRTAPTVLTPHDGEYARLAGRPPSDDRLASARELARQLGVIVLLKGPLTAVASADQAAPDVLLAAAGVPALATAGTGDVLSGIIGALLARGVDAHRAAALAAHAHGRAVARGRPQGLVAGHLPDLVADYLSQWGADG